MMALEWHVRREYAQNIVSSEDADECIQCDAILNSFKTRKKRWFLDTCRIVKAYTCARGINARFRMLFLGRAEVLGSRRE